MNHGDLKQGLSDDEAQGGETIPDAKPYANSSLLPRQNSTSDMTEVWEHLGHVFTPSRIGKMRSVIENRSHFIRLALQDIHDPHNVSACLRSAEAFGLCDVDVLAIRQGFKPSKASRGVHNWLRVHKHASGIGSFVESLRETQDIKIAAGFPPHRAEMRLEDIPLDRPLCVVFGNEHAGLHEDWHSHVDYRFTIPMVGFVESLNISVSAAITLHHLRLRAEKEVKTSRLYLTKSEKIEILKDWTAKHFGEEKSSRILKNF